MEQNKRTPWNWLEEQLKDNKDFQDRCTPSVPGHLEFSSVTVNYCTSQWGQHHTFGKCELWTASAYKMALGSISMTIKGGNF